MGKRGATRVTAQDIAQAGDLPRLIKQLVKRMIDGEMEIREHASVQISSLALQGHGEHCEALHKAGAVRPLVQLLMQGGAKSQSAACGALGAIANAKDEHQNTLVEAGGVPPLVRLLKTGSPKVQEQVMNSPHEAAPPCCLQNVIAHHNPDKPLSPSTSRAGLRYFGFSAGCSIPSEANNSRGVHCPAGGNAEGWFSSSTSICRTGSGQCCRL